MKEKKASRLRRGMRVKYKPLKGGKKRLGTVETDGRLGRMVSVQLDGDPFPIYTDYSQLETTKNQTEGAPPMATATKNDPTTRDLRKAAKAEGVDGWDTMDRAELLKAVKATGNGKKASESKAKATKSTAKKAAAAPKGKATAKGAKAKSTKAKKENTGPNPWREGSNFWHITEALIKGGKRSAMVKALKKKIDLKPRNGQEIDVDAELDRRILVCAQTLVKDHGFTKEMEGRGTDATISVTPPK